MGWSLLSNKQQSKRKWPHVMPEEVKIPYQGKKNPLHCKGCKAQEQASQGSVCQEVFKRSVNVPLRNIVCVSGMFTVGLNDLKGLSQFNSNAIISNL